MSDCLTKEDLMGPEQKGNPLVSDLATGKCTTRDKKIDEHSSAHSVPPGTKASTPLPPNEGVGGDGAQR
jgi:hypothetical protein